MLIMCHTIMLIRIFFNDLLKSKMVVTDYKHCKMGNKQIRIENKLHMVPNRYNKIV